MTNEIQLEQKDLELLSSFMEDECFYDIKDLIVCFRRLRKAAKANFEILTELERNGDLIGE